VVAAMFIVVGVVFTPTMTSALRQQMPWITIAVGAAMLAHDSIVDAGTNLQTRFVLFTQFVGASRIAPVIVGVTALAFLGFRLRHRNIGTIDTKTLASRPIPSPSSLDQAATSETTSAL
jgi:hypothetical protein